MKILIFPTLASVIMISFSLFFLWSDFDRRLGRKIHALPIKSIGLFWLLMAAGTWLASAFVLKSFFVYLAAVFMTADAVTFIFIPPARLAKSFIWYSRKGELYRRLYSLFLIVIGAVLLWEISDQADRFLTGLF